MRAMGIQAVIGLGIVLSAALPSRAAANAPPPAAAVELTDADRDLVGQVCDDLNTALNGEFTVQCRILESDGLTARTGLGQDVTIDAGLIKALKSRITMEQQLWLGAAGMCPMPSAHPEVTSAYAQVLAPVDLGSGLAFIVGHEIGHSNRFLEAARQGRLSGIVRTALDLQGWLTGAGDFAASLFEVIDTGLAGVFGVLGYQSHNVTQTHQSGKELDADAAAIALAQAAGYDPVTVIASSLLLFEGNVPASTYEQWRQDPRMAIVAGGGDHPSNAERVARLSLLLCAAWSTTGLEAWEPATPLDWFSR